VEKLNLFGGGLGGLGGGLGSLGGGGGGGLGLLAGGSVTESSHGAVDTWYSVLSEDVGVADHSGFTSWSLVAWSNSPSAELAESLHLTLSRGSGGVTTGSAVASLSTFLLSVTTEDNNS